MVSWIDASTIFKKKKKKIGKMPQEVMHSSKENYWVGIALSWGKNEKKQGGSFPYVCCGLFGRKGIERLLMMLSNPTKQSNQFFGILS